MGPEGFGAVAATGGGWVAAGKLTGGVDGAGGAAGAGLGSVAAEGPAQAARIATSDNKTSVSANFLFMNCVLPEFNVLLLFFFEKA
jgi:hypothetical protein